MAGVQNVVSCRYQGSGQQMFYPSFCMFTLQISHVQQWHHLLRIKRHRRFTSAGLRSERRGNTAHVQNEQSHWRKALLLWQRRENKELQWDSPWCYFYWCGIDRLNSHGCSSRHDTRHELVAYNVLGHTTQLDFLFSCDSRCEQTPQRCLPRYYGEVEGTMDVTGSSFLAFFRDVFVTTVIKHDQSFTKQLDRPCASDSNTIKHVFSFQHCL